jgi:hypothetical protein
MKKLTTGLLLGFCASLVALLVQLARAYHLPGNQSGYAPAQPIAFSHKLHAGDLKIDCLFCHYAASKSPHAGIPSSTLCLNCHRQVTASWDAMREEEDKARQEGRPPRRIQSTELKKLYTAMGLNDELQPAAGKQAEPLRWVKVHNLPDYTRFDHRVHVNAKVKCQECHGPVETMEVIRQAADLSMGWCVKCHRDMKETEGAKRSPSTDCAACHY